MQPTLVVIERSDAGVVVSKGPADLGFSVGVLAAIRSGVKVYAYRCRISLHRLFFSYSILVRFPIE